MQFLKSSIPKGTKVAVSGVPTTSTYLAKGGFATATASAVINTTTETAILAIQTSPDNSIWTDLVSHSVSGNFTSAAGETLTPSVSGFIGEKLYVRFNLTGTAAYKLSINGTLQPYT